MNIETKASLTLHSNESFLENTKEMKSLLHFIEFNYFCCITVTSLYHSL